MNKLVVFVLSLVLAGCSTAQLRPAPTAQLSSALFLRMLARFPILRRIPARLVGMGIRPEHVTTPKAESNRSQRVTA